MRGGAGRTRGRAGSHPDRHPERHPGGHRAARRRVAAHARRHAGGHRHAGPPAEPAPTAEPAPAPTPAAGPTTGAAATPTRTRTPEPAGTRASVRKPGRSPNTASGAGCAGAQARGSDRRCGSGTPTPAPTLGNASPPPDRPAAPGPAATAVPDLSIDGFRIPPYLLPIYQAAGARYGVRWEVLAAINEIESDYGRNLNVSSAGALGWMQFMPESWTTYGVDADRDGVKDPYDPTDAIYAAAHYLSSAGAETDLRRAVFAYNRADWYVDSVLLRARAIAGLPARLVGALAGMARHSSFPVRGPATYAGRGTWAGIDIRARAGAAAVAVAAGRIAAVGENRSLGRYVRLRDAYGNTYTYAQLATIARTSPERSARATRKQRLFAHPRRPAARASAGAAPLDAFAPKLLRAGARVRAGAVLGRLGRAGTGRRSRLRFAIRAAGRSAPRLDPEPILDGWRLASRRGRLFGAGSSSALGGILGMSDDELTRTVLADRRIDIYGCGRQDIAAGRIGRRVLATLEFLAASGLDPTVSSLECGHGYLTASGNVSEHSSGDAVDIAAINGISIFAHQGAGSITAVTIRRLLSLQGEMTPHQIISLMAFDGAPNTFAMPDHDDHIHVGFRPLSEPLGAPSSYREVERRRRRRLKG